MTPLLNRIPQKTQEVEVLWSNDGAVMIHFGDDRSLVKLLAETANRGSGHRSPTIPENIYASMLDHAWKNPRHVRSNDYVA